MIACPACGGTGAVANVALHHANELSKEFRVTLISDSFPEENTGGAAFLEIRPKSFNWLRRFGHVPREYAFAWTVGRRLRQLHGYEPVDIVMCHGHSVAALAAKPMKEKSGVPYVIVTHGDIFDRPKGTYDFRLTWFYKKVTRPAYRVADLVVALSPYMGELAIRGGADPEHVKVIPNGVCARELGLVDNEIQSRISTGDGRLEILYIGRLSIEKGVDVLIEACAQLKKNGTDFQLRIGGEGTELGNLERKVDTMEIGDETIFLGHVERKFLGRLYQSAHVVCVPSRSDPLPTVVLEAMASGVTVVGTEVGGIPFMIKPDITGQTFPVGDSVALAEILEKLANNFRLVREMGQAGQQRVAKKFSWPEVGSKLHQEIYNLRCRGK